MTPEVGSLLSDRNASGSGASFEAVRWRDSIRALEDVQARLIRLREAGSDTAEGRLESLCMLDEQMRVGVKAVFALMQHDVAGAAEQPSREVRALLRDLTGCLFEDFRDAVRESDALQQSASAQRRTECRNRAARTAADRVFWERAAGGPPHADVWRWLGGESMRRSAGAPVGALAPGARERGDSAFERELVRALAAVSVALDQVPPHFLGAAYQVLAFSIPLVRIEPSPFEGATFVFALEDSDGPRRLARPPEGDAASCYFSPGMARDALREIQVRVDGGEIPFRFLDGAGDARLLRHVLDHFLHYWAPVPPLRRHRRHRVGGAIAAVRGLEAIRLLLQGNGEVGQVEWSLHDVSRRGVGAYVPTSGSEPVRPGELVGLRATGGGNWQLAVVRRTWSSAGERELAGLETLSLSPVASQVDDGHVRVEVLLCDPVLRGEAVRVAAPVNTLLAGAPLFISGSGKIQKLKPLNGEMQGDGFELRVYQVL